MKQLKIIIALMLLSLGLQAQNVADLIRTTPIPATGANKNNRATVDANLKAALALNIPHFATNTLNGSKDSIGYIGYNTVSNKFVVYRGGGVWDSYATIDDVNSVLPFGTPGQILKNIGGNKYTSRPPISEGIYVRTQAQLDAAKLVTPPSQSVIFSTWGRYAHGLTGARSDDIPSAPLQTNSWGYNSTSNFLYSTNNFGGQLGFFSKEKYSSYTHFVTLTSTDTDNDQICTDIAFIEDAADMVPNTAYGLNPSSFNWPINTSSQYIPNQHVLSLIRNRNGSTLAYAIVYDYGKTTQKTIVDGGASGVWTVNSAWNSAEVDVKVVLRNDSVFVSTTNFSDAPGGKGAMGYTLPVSLNSDPLLLKFKGSVSYGYSAISQPNSQFKNISINRSSSDIFDLRNGDVWVYQSGAYVKDVTRNGFAEIGPLSYLYNPTTAEYIYLRSDNTFFLIGGASGGTVTNVASGYGLLGGPITTTGTLRADTASATGLVSKGNLANTLGSYTTKGDTTKAPILVTLGSSLTSGINVNNVRVDSLIWAYKTPKALGYSLTNRGLSGRRMQETTSTDSSIYSVRNTLPSYQYKNSLITIESYVNDSRADTTVFTTTIYKSRLNSTIDALVSKGWPLANIILFQPSYYNQATAANHGYLPYRQNIYAAAMLDVATTRGTRYLDLYSSMKALQNVTHDYVGADSLHMTIKGNQYASDQLTAYIQTFNSTVYPITAYNSKVTQSLYVNGNESVKGSLNVGATGFLRYLNVGEIAYLNRVNYSLNSETPFVLDNGDMYRDYRDHLWFYNGGYERQIDQQTIRSNGSTGNAGQLTIQIPSGGYFLTTASSTGAIAITLPTLSYPLNTYLVIKGTIKANSTNDQDIDFTISGDARANASTWQVTTARINGNAATSNYQVRFARSGTNKIIYIGELTTVWGANLNVSIDEVVANGPGATIPNLGSGWAIGIENTAFQTIDVTKTTTFGGANLAQSTGVTPVSNGGTGTSTATGTGNLVLAVSPTLTGVPLAPTAATATNTTQVATTAFVKAQGYYSLPALTAGSSLFSDGTTVAQDNANYFWDNTNKRLGIGTNAPGSKISILNNALGITGDKNSSGIALLNNTASTNVLNQISPAVVLGGSGWNTTTLASVPIRYSMDVSSFSGAETTSGLSFKVSYDNGSTWAEKFVITGSGASTPVDFTSNNLVVNGRSQLKGNIETPFAQIGTLTSTSFTNFITALNVNSFTKGWLKPRMPTVSRNSIANPGGTVVHSVQVTNGGSGYTTATVSFSGGSPTTAATATATIIGGSVAYVVMTGIGVNYVSMPTVTITGDGTGATAIANPLPVGLEIFNLNTERTNSYTSTGWKEVAYTSDITGGGGTVTNVATGYGLSGGPITTTGTLLADTTSTTALVSKSRLATNLGGYTKTSTTVAGFPLTANVTLATLQAGYGVAFGGYDGSLSRTVVADTSTANALVSKINLASQMVLKAPIASPTFTGTVSIPTPFNVGGVSVTTTGTKLNFLTGAAGMTGVATSSIVFSNSPTFVGTPAAPTAVATTNTTQIATTAFVKSQLPLDNVLSKSANYTILTTDYAVGNKSTLDIYVDATAGNVTITGLSAAASAGYTIYITKTDASANTVTFASTSTIFGGAVISTQNQSKQFNSNSTAYYNH